MGKFLSKPWMERFLSKPWWAGVGVISAIFLAFLGFLITVYLSRRTAPPPNAATVVAFIQTPVVPLTTATIAPAADLTANIKRITAQVPDNEGVASCPVGNSMHNHTFSPLPNDKWQESSDRKCELPYEFVLVGVGRTNINLVAPERSDLRLRLDLSACTVYISGKTTLETPLYRIVSYVTTDEVVHTCGVP